VARLGVVLTNRAQSICIEESIANCLMRGAVVYTLEN
jgi:hypothetical protein